MKRTKFIRVIIGVEKKLGFLYIPAKAQEYMPIETSKVKILLEGESEQILSYNKDHKRLFGLTSWYRRHNITTGTVLEIIFSENIISISRSKNDLHVNNIIEETSIDLEGLSSRAKGNIVEDRIKELILLYGQGLLNVYKPVIDEKGIDLIIMRDGVFMPIYLQVKSRFNTHETEMLLIDVNDKTFTSHESFFVIGASFNPKTLEIDEKLLLIPSKVFEKKATPIKGYDKKRVSVSMKENTKSQWAKSFINKSELVEKLMEKFEEMSRYIK